MRTDLGGLRRDPLRQERAPLDRESKRGIASGVRMVQPLCGYPAARIVQTGAQTLTNITWTAITMDSTTFDNDGIADLANDQVIVKFPGLYLLTGLVDFAIKATPTAAESRYARFLVNGVGVGESGGYRLADGAQIRVQCNEMVSLSRGGTIKLQGYQDSGGNLNTFVTTNASFLAAVWVGVPS